MHKFLGLFCLGLFVSCEFLVSTEEKTQKLVREELKIINWNDVDQYPLFRDCDETAPKALQRQCFQTTMSGHFSQALKGLEFRVDRDLHDTVYIDFVIDEQGFISVLNMENKTTTFGEIAGLTTKIAEQLYTITPVKPAVKRGLPVRLRFRLPIVLHTP